MTKTLSPEDWRRKNEAFKAKRAAEARRARAIFNELGTILETARELGMCKKKVRALLDETGVGSLKRGGPIGHRKKRKAPKVAK